MARTSEKIKLIQNHQIHVSFLALCSIHFIQFQISNDSFCNVIPLTCFFMSCVIFIMNFTNLESLLCFHRYYFHQIPNQNISFLDSHLFQLVCSQIPRWARILLTFKVFSFFNEHDVLISLVFYLLKILDHFQSIHFIIGF